MTPTEQRERVARKYSEIRALWHKHGGYQSGPRVEHVSMPEARFDGFLSDFLALLSAPQDRDVGLLEEVASAWASVRNAVVNIVPADTDSADILKSLENICNTYADRYERIKSTPPSVAVIPDGYADLRAHVLHAETPIATMDGGMHRLDLTIREFKALQWLLSASPSPVVDAGAPGEMLNRALLDLVRLCHRDGIGDLDLNLGGVTVDGTNTGDWHLTLRSLKGQP